MTISSRQVQSYLKRVRRNNGNSKLRGLRVATVNCVSDTVLHLRVRGVDHNFPRLQQRLPRHNVLVEEPAGKHNADLRGIGSKLDVELGQTTAQQLGVPNTRGNDVS